MPFILAMNNGKSDDIYKLLVDNNFEMNGNIPDELKCLKCGKILINAYQGPCGCRYCRSCRDELLESGCRVCHGNTDECKNESLVSFHQDYVANKKISKLVVKCPEEMCSFESELIDINTHLRVCPNKSFECVFRGLGCDKAKLAAAQINQHLQLENYGHMKMMMDVIDNMRNEIDRLKENDVRNTNEIQMLKNKEEINMIDINLWKSSNERTNNEIETLKENERRNRDEIDRLSQDLLTKDKRIESLEEDLKLINTNFGNISNIFSMFQMQLWQRMESAETHFESKIKEKKTEIEVINKEIKSIGVILFSDCFNCKDYFRYTKLMIYKEKSTKDFQRWMLN